MTHITQASDHIISLILKCNEHQSQNIAQLVDSYRSLNLFLEPITPECVPCPLEDYPEHARAAFVPQADGVTLTEQPSLPQFLVPAGCVPTPEAGGPPTTTEQPAPARRTRRTKEQIAADEAAAKAAVSGSAPEEPAENPETTPETPPELPAEEEAPAGDIPALRAEIGRVFAERKIEPGFKSALANFLKAHDSETVVKLADVHIPALLKTLKEFQP